MWVSVERRVCRPTPTGIRPTPAPTPAAPHADTDNAVLRVTLRGMKLVAVTACPTGIAHTYMAAEQLEKTAKALGHQIKVETQGAMGIENALSDKDIREADAAIFAVDIEVEKKERFGGKRIVQVPVREAIKNPHA